MNIGAVLGAATIIAAAILFTNHWEIIQSTLSPGIVVTMRLDRWTGSISLCDLDKHSVQPGTWTGSRVPCE
jgi:hypothetical protein